MRKHPKKYKNIIIVVALCLGLGVGLLVIPSLYDYFSAKEARPYDMPQQSSEKVVGDILNVADWTDYSNSEFPVKFKYSRQLVMNVFDEPNQDIGVFEGINFGRKKLGNGTHYQDDLEQLGYVISVRADRATELKDITAGETTSPVTIGKLAGTKITGSGVDEGKTKVVFEHSKVLYIFTLTRYGSNTQLIDEGELVFQKMLDSIYF